MNKDNDSLSNPVRQKHQVEYQDAVKRMLEIAYLDEAGAVTVRTNDLLTILKGSSVDREEGFSVAAPQPAPVITVKPLKWVDAVHVTDPITDEILESHARAGGYHYLAEAVGCSLNQAKKRVDKKHRDFILSQIEIKLGTEI